MGLCEHRSSADNGIIELRQTMKRSTTGSLQALACTPTPHTHLQEMYREDGGSSQRQQVNRLAEGVTVGVPDRLPEADSAQRRRCVGCFVFFELTDWWFLGVFQVFYFSEEITFPCKNTILLNLIRRKSAGPDRVH